MRTPLRIETALSERDLSRLARQEADPRVRQRLLAIRLVVMGRTVPHAAEAGGLKQRQLRNWVHRFQAEGVEGLRDRPRPGQPKHLPTDREKAFQARLRQPGRGVILRGKDIQRLLREEFGAVYTMAGTYFLLHRLGFSSLSPRPVHPKTDPQAQDDFKKTR
jgi:transposase